MNDQVRQQIRTQVDELIARADALMAADDTDMEAVDAALLEADKLIDGYEGHPDDLNEQVRDCDFQMEINRRLYAAWTRAEMVGMILDGEDYEVQH